ncbi:MAG: phosphatase PAP2 family protein [Dehalococcoidia bacterium]
MTGRGWRPVFWAWWLLAALAFAITAGFAAATDYFPADLWLTHRLQDADSDALGEALDWGARLAEMPQVAAIGVVAVIGLVLLTRQPLAVLLLVALVVPSLNGVVKSLVDRPRPAAHLVEVGETATDPSFPSGHVTAAVLVYGFIFYLASVLIPARPLRLLVQAACLAVIGLTAVQRVYVGVHWPSDVLGGFLFGGLLLALLIWGHRRLRRLTAAA